MTQASATWLRACAIFLAALLALATLDMLAKDVVRRHPSQLVNLVRYGFVLMLALALMRARRASWRIERRLWPPMLLRGAMLGTVGLTFMEALRTMPLAEATAIYFVSPLIIVALSPWLLGEKVAAAQWLAVLAGFGGMLLIVRPGGSLPLVGTVLMGMAALAYAMVQILTRRLAGQVSAEQQFAWTSAVCMVMTIASLPTAGSWGWPEGRDLLQMLAVGALSGVGQYLLIRAFQLAPASALAPFNYFHLLLALVFSVLVFDQRPDGLALAGIALIAAAGLMLTLPVFRRQWRERMAARRGM